MEKDYKKLYEEEHKKYEDALGRARGHHSVASHYNNANEIQELEHIFPELKEKESEDERIRKELISLVKEIRVTDRFYDLNKMIAWLEKQGEQKTKVIILKFRIGDVIIKSTKAKWEKPVRIVSIEKDGYSTVPIDTYGGGFIGFAFEEEYELYKQEWSEEDETKLRTAQTFIRNTSLIEVDGIKEATIDWLKSLKDRITPTNKNDFDRGYEVGISAAKFNQWKPTEEQLNALHDAIESYCGTYRSTLNSLYNNLKKL